MRKRLIFWLPIAGIVIFVGAYYYPDLLIHYAWIAADWFTKDSEVTRNVIYLIAALVGFYYINRRTMAAEREANISEQNIRITEQNIKNAEKNIASERFTLATEQLASEQSSIRLRGARSLEQIAKSHEDERETIVQILSDHIRKLSPADDTKKIKENRERLEIESTITILSNIAEPLGSKKRKIFDLSRIDLSQLRLAEINLSYFILKDTNLSGTIFLRVDFTGANFAVAVINHTNFKESKGLTQKQIMRAVWKEGRRPRGLPDEWELPSACSPF